MAYGGSQARRRIRDTAAGLHHSQSNTGSLIYRVRPGTEPASSWVLVRFVTTEPRWELLFFLFASSMTFRKIDFMVSV